MIANNTIVQLGQEEPMTQFRHEFVMLVDDDRTVNFINLSLLEKQKFARKVEVYSNPVEAFSYLEEAAGKGDYGAIPNILFLDLTMPVLSGAEFIDKFDLFPLEVRKHCCIIILSSYINAVKIQPLVNKRPYIAGSYSKPLMPSNLKSIDKDIERVSTWGS
jgi:CheY-like chemotaxis protein